MTIDTKTEGKPLIASNKVEGTAVYNPQGERLGTIYNFMVDKEKGTVEYAVMSFGGFLGIGENYHPLPWNVLTYDPERGGYVVDIDEEALKDAPSYPPGEEPRYDHAYGEAVYGFYGIPYLLP
jgi:sporulation protein YlmC with PRC-barrel domain